MRPPAPGRRSRPVFPSALSKVANHKLRLGRQRPLREPTGGGGVLLTCAIYLVFSPVASSATHAVSTCGGTFNSSMRPIYANSGRCRDFYDTNTSACRARTAVQRNHLHQPCQQMPWTALKQAKYPAVAAIAQNHVSFFREHSSLMPPIPGGALR